MFEKKTIKDVKVKDKIVLVRVDYNVPLKDGKITSDLRIRASLPTINYLIENGAKKIILISHLGRPEGMKNPDLSLKPVTEALKGLISVPVTFISDVSGPDVEEGVKKAPKGSVVLLENLRFWGGEERNSSDFAREIVESVNANLFVQDGFAVIHRAHASTEAITHELPSVAGFLVEKEVSTLNSLMTNPKHPFWLVIGGAKVDDKQPLIDNLSKKVDEVFVGGKVAADGYETKNKTIHVAKQFKENSEGKKWDISREVAEDLAKWIHDEAKTVLWNGALGYVEQEGFSEGSEIVARAIGEKTAEDKSFTSIICGGDTTGFVENLATKDESLKYTLISTGGGASLELLSGLELPGLDSLEDK